LSREGCSLAEVREIYNLLREIEGKMNEVDQHKADTEKAIMSLNQAILLTNRLFSLLKRMGLPENVTQTAMIIQQLIGLFRYFELVMVGIQAGMGPVGWMLLALGFATTTLSTMSISRSYG